MSTLGPLLALILASIFFATRTDRFLTSDNLSLVVQQVAVVGIIAIGQTLIILTAGIDLSCGAVMALGTIVMTRLAVTHGLNPYLAIGLGLGVCLAFGVLNGVLVTGLRLPPFIVTLGTLNIAMALVHKGGVDQHRYLDILTSTLFGAPVYKTYGALIADRKFEPAGFAAPLAQKDIRLALAAAEDLRVPLPIANLLRDRFLTLLAHGGEKLDWSAIGQLAAKDAGEV